MVKNIYQTPSKLKNKISIRDQEFFLNEKNPYCAFWIYDNDVMRRWTKSTLRPKSCPWI